MSNIMWLKQDRFKNREWLVMPLTTHVGRVVLPDMYSHTHSTQNMIPQIIGFACHACELTRGPDRATAK